MRRMRLVSLWLLLVCLVGTMIVQKQATNNEFTQYNLPKSGKYDLIMIPNYATGQTTHAQSILVSANKLAFPDTYIPQVTLRNMHLYETVTTPFSVQPGILNNGPTKYLELRLNDKVLVQNLLPNGKVQAYTINPTTLPDGVYQMVLKGESPDSPNQGVAYRNFYVDHVDTFSDVPTKNWAHKPIEILIHLNILHGSAPISIRL